MFRRDSLQTEQETTPRYKATLEKLLPILPESAQDPENVTVGVLSSRTQQQALSLVEERVQKITAGQSEVVFKNLGDISRAMLIVFPRTYIEEIQALLGKEGISRLRIPDKYADASPEAALEVINTRLEAIPGEVEEIEAELENLADQWDHKLTAWFHVLQDKLAEYKILSHFGETEQTFVIMGWVPAAKLSSLKEALDEPFDGRVVVQQLPVEGKAKAQMPVELQNPRVAEPFEPLVKLLALPKQGSLDPTGLMALFLPLLFGMILGDAGYGMVLLLVAFLLRRRFQDGIIRDLLAVLAIGSAWAILFGFLFGEFFGTFGESFGLQPVLFHRTSEEYLPLLLALAVGVGGVHLMVGLVLGVWEAVRQRSRHQLLERSGMLIGLIALFLLVGALVEILPEGFITPAVAGVIVGIVLLSVPLGWVGLLLGPIEFIGLIGNTLSYLRIAAIGLASVYLAKVANDIAGVIGNLIVGVIIAALIHALNIALGAFSPAIHSLRLHYVEFFQKFYEGGGRPYQPFRRRINAPEGIKE
jgi:V/A-type H+-transporting ATPase subunit I